MSASAKLAPTDTKESDPVNDYESKQEAKRARLQEAADRKRGESAAKLSGARARADAIPFGQPILVGHHSEKRHRSDVDKIDRGMRAGFEAAKEAEDLDRRADAVGTGGISSDDPEAVVKLRAELASLTDQQTKYKKENTAAKKAGSDPPWPAYKLTNNGANMRRIQKRIDDLLAKADDVTSEQTINGVRIVDNVEDNRLQMHFDGKPAPDVITLLKVHGFKWSPSSSTWQRFRSNAATWAAETIAKTLI